MSHAGLSPELGVEAPAVDSGRQCVDGDVAVESVFYALFRIVELAEYSGPETAIEWAQSALADRQLLHGFVERVRERPAADRRPAGSPGVLETLFPR